MKLKLRYVCEQPCDRRTGLPSKSTFYVVSPILVSFGPFGRLMLVFGIASVLFSGCGSMNRSADARQEQVKQQVVSTDTEAQNVDSAQMFFRSLESRYEFYRKPLTLNAWRKAVGDSVEDVSGYTEAETSISQ